MSDNAVKMKRRTFIKSCAVIGSSLVVGIHLQGCGDGPHREAAYRSKTLDELQANAWIKIREDNTVTILVSHCEMGQGISTALCMIVAEEL